MNRSDAVRDPLDRELFPQLDEDAELLLSSAATDSLLSRSLARLAPDYRTQVATAVAGSLAEALHLNLTEDLMSIWRRYDALRTAALRSTAAPGQREIVPLREDSFVVRRTPAVHFTVDGEPAWTVELTVRFEIKVTGVVATIVDGRLFDLGAGWCDITPYAAIDGIELHTRPVHIPLKGHVRLGSGISLVPAMSRVPSPR